MVSLRTNVPLRHGVAFSAAAFLLLGIGLTAPALMSLAGSRPTHVDVDARNLPFDLARVNLAVHRATTHSDQRRIAITENWLQWSVGKLYSPLARTQDPRRLLAGKLTDCSERSQILKSLAESAGHRCRFVGLDGHVVLEVETSRGWQVADPDYGVVYPVGIAGLQEPEAEPMIRSKLAAAGHREPQVEQYLDIVQSAKDNVVLPIGSPLSPRLAAVERWCDRLALPLPLGMIVLGLVLASVASPRRFADSARTLKGTLTPVACETGLRPRSA